MSVSADPLAALREALPADRFDEPTDADRIGGIEPSVVVLPRSEQEVALALRACSAAGLAVVAGGSGRARDWGAPPRRCDALLRLTQLDRIVEHEPGDLVCVVEAGVTLGVLRERLASASQGLMLDPAGREASTLGGIAATAASGPLRQRYGTMRDLCIGMRFVLADGTVGHSGGKVVKNVAGYDVAKLLIGSLGTLAVITQLALRLHPLAEARRTVTLRDATPSALADAVAAVDALRVDPVAVEVVGGRELTLAIRLEGTETGVAERGDAVATAIGGAPLEASEADAFWVQTRDMPWGGDGPVAGIAFPCARLEATLDACLDAGVEVALRAGVGSGEVRLAPDSEADAVVGLRRRLADLGGNLVLHRATQPTAPVAWPDGDRPDLSLMRALKSALDPATALSPGRFLGGI